jgi:hypothetical protein
MLPNGMAGVEFNHEHQVLYKVFLSIMITCTNAFSAKVNWIGSPGLSSFAASRSCHSSIAENNFLQRLVGGSRAARARLKDQPLLWKPAIDRIISLGRLVRYARHRCIVPSALASYLIHVRTHVISQNWDGQPIVKFYRHLNAMHIYRMIPRNKYFDVVCDHERSEKPPIKATNWSGIKNDKPSKKIRLSRYQSLDKKHF